MHRPERAVAKQTRLPPRRAILPGSEAGNSRRFEGTGVAERVKSAVHGPICCPWSISWAGPANTRLYFTLRNREKTGQQTIYDSRRSRIFASGTSREPGSNQRGSKTIRLRVRMA